MKSSSFLVLLSAAVLLASAAPAVETVPCTQDGAAAAARSAIHDINKNHRHGYKFRLKETKGSNLEKVRNESSHMRVAHNCILLV